MMKLKECRVLTNLYDSMCDYPFFRGNDEHKYSLYNIWEEQVIYNVDDVDLWFDSDFEEGYSEEKIRVSKKSKYKFKDFYKNFYFVDITD